MALWRFGRGWNESEVRAQLRGLHALERNFDADPEELPRNVDADPEELPVNFDADPEELPGRSRWQSYASESVISIASPGSPAGAFDRARDALASYAFSDSRIVRAHFDADAPLLHRRMLLEMTAFRLLHYLSGVVVGAVRSQQTTNQTEFGFRYDTLEGHIERGAEWFTIRKDHHSGQIRFRISATWMPGEFPNWWSRFGFQIVGKYYQRKWHLRAHEIMSEIAMEPADDQPRNVNRSASLPHIIFERPQ